MEAARGAHRTKTDVAVEALREAIARGEIKPGQRLIVAHLSQALGMSATPIREAIRILEAEGLISHQPHQGVSVADLSLEDVEEIHLLRGLLEGMATRLAVPRLTDAELTRLRDLANEVEAACLEGDQARLTKANADWHLFIYRAARSKYLWEFLLRLWSIFPWDTIWMIPGRAGQSVLEHTEIMKAIQARDAERAAQLMQGHILQNKQSALQYLSAPEMMRKGPIRAPGVASDPADGTPED